MKVPSIDITPLYNSLRKDLRDFLSKYSQENSPPKVALVIVGDDPASLAYLNSKKRLAEKLGIESEIVQLSEDIDRKTLLGKIEELSSDNRIDGVMVENTIPEGAGITYPEIVDHISPWKDLDGSSTVNMGRTAKGLSSIEPATARSVMETIRYLDIPIGSRICIVNRSITVGRPLAMMLLNRSFTPIVCHSRSIDIKTITGSSPVVVTAVGRAGMIDRSYLSDDAVVIDVGINSVDGRIMGDLDVQSISGTSIRYTPVPGGIGKLTSLLIFDNLRLSLERKRI